MKFSIRTLYLYLFSFIGLLITVFGAIRLVNVGMRTFLFPDVDNYSYVRVAKLTPEGKEVPESDEEVLLQEENQKRDISRQRQRELIEGLSFIFVGLPLYAYHWNVIKKEPRDKRKSG